MARIFLSHSSSDNDYARALRDWLVAEGWDDLFLDFDPERGIAAGEKWEKALLDAAGRCEAVLFVVTRNWLGSGWCLKEFHLAEKLNKRMFMLLADGLGVADLPPELTAEWQLVDLTPGAEWTGFQVSDGFNALPREVRFSSTGLKRLRSGLNRAGLDPRFFAWPPGDDPQRPPYRGLRALEADDAGIFFGREAQTIAALDRLRGLRDGAPPRVLTILGASGAGKSSFLRAGLLPRLQRDDRHFLALPVIRPERSVMTGETGFIRALVAALSQQRQPFDQTAAEALVQAGPAAIVEALKGAAMRAAVPALAGEPTPRPPSIVLSIDQGEELFLAEGAAESAAFLELIAALTLSPQLNFIVLIAIRSDSYEALQTAPQLEAIGHSTLSLPPMPRGAYSSVINGPAQRLTQSGGKLAIEPALTQALLADIEDGGAKDALPLLAFTLELLYRRHGQDGRLTLADYTALGRIKGSIEVAVENAMAAADADPRIPKDRDLRLALMRSAFIPWLAGVDRASNSVRRRVARMAEVPPEARPLVECLIGARLLATDITLERDVTVEPAHEALLRQWSLLQGWLEEDFAAMAALEGVQRAARDWEANLRDPGWLAHSAGRLEDAEASHAQPNLSAFLSASEQEYLRACRIADDTRRNRELEEARKLANSRAQTVRRTRIGLGAALVLAAAAGLAGWYATQQRDEAERQRTVAVAEQKKAQSSLAVVNARSAVRDQRLNLAAAHALSGYRTLANLETRSALFEAGRTIDPHLDYALPPGVGAVTAMAWLTGNELLLATKNGTRTGLEPIRLMPGMAAERLAAWRVPTVMHDAEDEASILAMAAPGDGTLVAARSTGVVEIYDAAGHRASWQPAARTPPHSFSRAAVSADGRHIVFGGAEEALFVHCAARRPEINTLSCASEEPVAGAVTAVAIDPGGAEAFAAMADGGIVIGGGTQAARRWPMAEAGLTITALAPSGKRLAAIVQPAGHPAGAANALALLDRRDNDLVVGARGPVNVGLAPALVWRTDSEVVHGCLSGELQKGPLCATEVADAGGVAGLVLATRLGGHSGPADLIAVSPDRTRVASRSLDRIMVWHWPSDRSIHGRPARTPAGGWASLASEPGGALLLASRDGAAIALAPGKDTAAQAALPVVAGDVITAVKVEGGRVIARSGTLSFVRDGESEAAGQIEMSASVLPQGGLIWAGAGTRVVVSLEDHSLGLVDFGSDAPELLEFAAPSGVFDPFGIVIDRRRNHVIASAKDGRVHVFDMATRRPVAVLANSHAADVAELAGAEGLAVSADGALLATTAAGNRVMLYDLERNTSIALLRTDSAETKSVAFDPQGRKLAVMDAASVIGVWSLAGNTPEHWLDIRTQPSHPNLPTALPTVAFGAEGSLVALTQWSEVFQFSLDETAWIRRIEALGYDRMEPLN